MPASADRRRGRTSNPRINGPKLRILRNRNGLTITQLAKLAGLSVSYVSQIELGDKPRVGPDKLVRLCAAVGVHAAELIIDDDGADPTPRAA